MPNETKNFIQKNALQLTLQAVALFVLILNLWLVSELSPTIDVTRDYSLADKKSLMLLNLL